MDGRAGGQAGPRAVNEREFGGEGALLFPLVVGFLVVWWRCAQT